MDLCAFLQDTFADATSAEVTGTTPQQIHRARARAWIQALTNQFRQRYAGSSVRVLSKYDQTHRAEFGLNELLYDVLVCEVNTVPSSKWGKTLVYIEDVMWQVESEFARDSRQALFDFNKLVLGAGHNKLFIGPQVRDSAAFINTLLPAARACTGSVFTSLIPHPSQWGTGESTITVWQCLDGTWSLLA